MRYKLLGRSGLKVSELCLGTMTFGQDWGDWGSNEDESRKVYDKFIEAGGNFVDTANLYTRGTSEKMLGKFIAPNRDKIVVATKYTNSEPAGDPNCAGNSRKNLTQSLDASLKRLNTDYIDLYWIHIWDFLTPIEEVMRALDDAVRAGKVLYVGISDAPAWVVSRANMLAELKGWTPFTALQIEYSLIERTPERELMPMARQLGIAVTPWGPLAGGVLTGKYLSKNGESKDGRYNHEMLKSMFEQTDRKDLIAREVLNMAKELKCTAAQISLAWLRQQPGTVIPIIGAKKVAQLEDNLGCLNIHLTDEQMAKLDKVSEIELGFPGSFYASDMVKTFMYGGMRDLIDV